MALVSTYNKVTGRPGMVLYCCLLWGIEDLVTILVYFSTLP